MGFEGSIPSPCTPGHCRDAGAVVIPILKRCKRSFEDFAQRSESTRIWGTTTLV